MTHHTYAYNPLHLIRDGRPWLPSMGEIHYSRCRPEDWRQSIRLMKAGGVDIAASYVFWNHHEAEEEVFDFTGCRDLGRFLDICDEEDMPVWLRIGPWCHGEARHGGFPDWLLASGCNLRTDDPAYLAYVRRFWEALYRQVKRHIGGCVIGIQYENELVGHPREHMTVLEALADEIGLKAPLHTATGWGAAAIGTSIPVFGGYPDEPWHWRLDKLPPSNNYIFSPARDDSNIGTHETPEDNVIYPLCFDPNELPYLTAEIGGGCQPTFNRRPISRGRDVGGIVHTKLGSGTAMIGIYVYHGGTNPGYALQESRQWGNGTECPELNYDFQAPISEYGKTTDAYRYFRRVFTFFRDFGEGMATMPAVFPADNPSNPLDLTHLRHCYRTDGVSGYLFVSNFVRGYVMEEHRRAFSIPTDRGEVVFPEMTFRDGDFGFFPFNLPLGNGRLVTANAQPLCKLNGKTYVFFTDREPVYNLDGDTAGTELLTISEVDSLNASKVTLNGREYLVICPADYTRDGDTLVFRITEDTPLRIYPDPKGGEGFADYTLTCPAAPVEASVSLLSENPLMKEFSLTVSPTPAEASDLLLDLDYDGNMAELFLDGRKVADQFSLGNGWHLGLKRFGGAAEFTLRVFALAENAPVYMENKPAFRHGFACALTNVRLTAEYAVAFTL